ncbi:MAG: TadE/TadG family type IV pilus assembly protein [Alphaproteobacteria bacterium]
MYRYGKYLANITKRFSKNRDGATALEFAILVIPFSALMFSIIELAIVFFISSTVSHAMQQTAREIRTGEFQAACGDAAAFKAKVCSGMSGLGNCMANLRIDVVTSPTGRFVPGLLPATPDAEDPANPGNPTILPDSYVDSPAQAVVVVRAQYYHPLTIPGDITRLSNQPGNRRLITAATAFRNEPFPGTGGC